MTAETTSDAPLVADVLSLGRAGVDRRGIGAALGMSEARMQALEEADDAFAVAMADAETLALVWFNRQIVERLEARWDWGLWLAFMEWHWPAEKPEPPPKKPNWRRWAHGVGFY